MALVGKLVVYWQWLSAITFRAKIYERWVSYGAALRSGSPDTVVLLPRLYTDKFL